MLEQRHIHKTCLHSAWCTYLRSCLAISILLYHFCSFEKLLTLHQLEGPHWLAELFTVVYVLDRKVKRRLHEPEVNCQMVISHPKTRTVCYPRGPPLRTSLSRSKPDMRTDAPLLTLPKTFSAQIAFSACYRGMNAGRLTIWYFAVFKN